MIYVSYTIYVRNIIMFAKEGEFMKRIAIVDDVREYQEFILRIINNYAEKFEQEFNISTFISAKNLIYELEENKNFDIYLLDIELPEMNGIDLGKKIREFSKSVYIIFISSYSKFALNGYEVGAYRYLMKNDITEKLPEVLQSILIQEQEEDLNEYYKIINNTKCVKFKFNDIIKVYKEGKNAIFLTTEGEYKERKALSNIYDKLHKEKFIRADQGAILNIKYISKVKSNVVYLKDGSSIMISRTNISKVKEQVSLYWGRDNR